MSHHLFYLVQLFTACSVLWSFPWDSNTPVAFSIATLFFVAQTPFLYSVRPPHDTIVFFKVIIAFCLLVACAVLTTTTSKTTEVVSWRVLSELVLLHEKEPKNFHARNAQTLVFVCLIVAGHIAAYHDIMWVTAGALLLPFLMLFVVGYCDYALQHEKDKNSDDESDSEQLLDDPIPEPLDHWGREVWAYVLFLMVFSFEDEILCVFATIFNLSLFAFLRRSAPRRSGIPVPRFGNFVVWQALLALFTVQYISPKRGDVFLSLFSLTALVQLWVVTMMKPLKSPTKQMVGSILRPTAYCLFVVGCRYK